MRRNDVDRESLVSRRDPHFSRNIETGGGVPNLPKNWGRGPQFSGKLGTGVPNFMGSQILRDNGLETVYNGFQYCGDVSASEHKGE